MPKKVDRKPSDKEIVEAIGCIKEMKKLFPDNQIILPHLVMWELDLHELRFALADRRSKKSKKE